MSRRLPHAALLVLATLLAGVVIYLTWPTRAMVFCEQLPQLTALAMCAATLLVFSFRALALGRAARQAGDRRDPRGAGHHAPTAPHGALHTDPRVPAGAAVLAALAFFLAVHFIAAYRKPCAAVQQQFLEHRPAPTPR